ncbi:hypothetical protein CVT25_012243 [Psilocybe cyanescens]|uniref:Uncharacterized protein n=1 Tax=Psilocybe cyanescens TaxID=93625 RepID=A0A409XFP9_PSICY|nr:hypothetical protein CVT25_012243 [Psilocybe cyanescens]
MSLPPLDPSEYGLPVPLVSDDIRHNQSGRLKRPAVKPREIEEISLGSATVSTIAVVAARETKERASPRKRRPGGAKRKRKDADDGDAAYPAKRVRVPRGAVGQTAEEDSSLDLMPNNDVGAPIPEVLSDPTDTSKRRSTRATGSLKRRDSSASETTSISANAINAEIATKPDALSPSNADIASKSLDLDPPIGNQEKEEGELSEGLNS